MGLNPKEVLRRFLRDHRPFVTWLSADFALFLVGLIAYLVVRALSPSWPRPFHFPSGLMTFSMILFALASSFVLQVALHSAARNDDAMVQRMAALGVVGWGTFLFLLAMEWGRLYFFEQVHLLSNPWNARFLGITYYGLSAYHALHVLGGCVWMVLAANHYRRFHLPELAVFVHFTNLLFILLALFLIFPSMDLGGF